MVKSLPIEQIELTPSCQARAEIHQDAVDDYAEVLRAGGELPPVEVELPPVEVELPPVEVELPPVEVEVELPLTLMVMPLVLPELPDV